MAKAVKTADELRDIIMERGLQSPICPVGMSVHVRRVNASWRIDCVLPTTSMTAHSDCCDLLTQIAAELREEFDLQALPG